MISVNGIKELDEYGIKIYKNWKRKQRTFSEIFESFMFPKIKVEIQKIYIQRLLL